MGLTFKKEERTQDTYVLTVSAKLDWTELNLAMRTAYDWWESMYGGDPFHDNTITIHANDEEIEFRFDGARRGTVTRGQHGDS